MSNIKKDSRGLAVPLLAAGAVFLAGAAASASAGEQELANPETDGQTPSVSARTSLNLHAALVRAGSDKDFARELIRNPEQFRSAYNLTEGQINVLRNSREVVEEPKYQAADFNYTLS